MTMLRLRRLLAYALLLTLPFGFGWGLPGCAGSCAPCERKPFSEKARSYFLGFKEGSYWIYQNTTNGDIDSVYFIEENITKQGASPDCIQEGGYIYYGGVSEVPRIIFAPNSWNNVFDMGYLFYGNYFLDNTQSMTVAGKAFTEVLFMTHCCYVSNPTCYPPNCVQPLHRFTEVAFAPNVGLIRWKVENHPKYGKATYELIRSRIIR